MGMSYLSCVMCHVTTEAPGPPFTLPHHSLPPHLPHHSLPPHLPTAVASQGLVASLPSLTSLEVQDNLPFVFNLSSLSSCTRLQQLCLWDCFIPSITPLQLCTSLTHLELAGVRGLQGQSVLAPLARHPPPCLRSLHLWCFDMRDSRPSMAPWRRLPLSLLMPLLVHCPALEELHLMATLGLTDRLLARAGAYLRAEKEGGGVHQTLYYRCKVVWVGGRQGGRGAGGGLRQTLYYKCKVV